MDEKFKTAGRGEDWLTWLGMPMLYDGGLCVNRTAEEHERSNKLYGRTPLGI